MTIKRIDLGFESEIIGRATARLQLGAEPSAEAIRAARLDAEAAGVQHLVTTVASGDLAAVRALAAAGFDLIDASVRLRRAPPVEAGAPIPEVRLAAAGDRETIVERCFDLFRLSRFYRDPFFSVAEADEIHRRWIDAALAGRADAVFVADDGGAPVAFLTAVVDEDAVTARIDLLAVVPEATRRGIGRRVTDAALGYFRGRVDQVVVKTQSDNFAALGVYTGAGFRVYASELTFAATMR